MREVWDTLRAVAIAVVIALLLRTFVVETFEVQGFSMEPTLQNGERLLVDKVAFHFDSVHVGQIVIIHPPLPAPASLVQSGIAEASCEYTAPSPVPFVKRVVAVGPAVIALRDGRVYVDGRLESEPWEPASWRDTFTSPVPVTVPKGYIYVLGDHRAASEDSRCFGPVSVHSIAGVAQLIWWPLGYARWL